MPQLQAEILNHGVIPWKAADFCRISLYSWFASTHGSGTASPTTRHASAAAHRSGKDAFESFFLNMKLLKYKRKNAILGKRPLRFHAHRLTQLNKPSTLLE
jgi:hypothetical protein